MAVIEVNKDTFHDEVLNREKIVLVDFFANWCGPCKMIRPILDSIALENEDIKIASVDIDEEDLLAEEYEVSSIPCLVLFKDGKEINRHVGMISRDDIIDMVGGK